MTLRRDHFLRNGDRITDGAVLALSLAGFGASRLNSRINDLGMALGRDIFLGNEYSIANRAVLAFRQTSLCAGWSLCCIDHFRMASRGDHFALLDLRTADGAHGIAGVAVLGTGSCFGITNFSTLMCARLVAPCAIGISNRIARRGILCFSISAVGIVQFRRGNGDVVLGWVTVILICFGLRTGGTLLEVYTGLLAGADVCTALGGVDAADGGQLTVDVQLYIC